MNNKEFAEIVINALKELSAVDFESRKKAPQIYDVVRKGLVGMPQSTFSQKMSYVVNKGLGISRRVPTVGYYLAPDNPPDTPDQPDSGQEVPDPVDPAHLPSQLNSVSDAGEPASSQIIRREKKLYPFVQAWLQERYSQVQDISEIKDGGVWGNPDVCGVSVQEFLTTREIEICTVEVKSSSLSWKKDIFEAVSHKRYANRSYFAFAQSIDKDLDELKDELRYYAERFKIGILIIYMKDESYTQYIKGPNSKELDTDDDEIFVHELSFAPKENVPLKYLKSVTNI